MGPRAINRTVPGGIPGMGRPIGQHVTRVGGIEADCKSLDKPLGFGSREKAKRQLAASQVQAVPSLVTVRLTFKIWLPEPGVIFRAIDGAEALLIRHGLLQLAISIFTSRNTPLG